MSPAKTQDYPKTFWERVQKGHRDDCWPWTLGTSKAGYGRMSVNSRPNLCHKLAWEYAHQRPLPPGRFALHTCDNPICCNPDHIYPGTPKDNSRDAVTRHRLARGLGERWGRAKLKNADIPAIRARAAAGEPQEAIAASFGVCAPHISRILSGKRWAGF